MLYLIKTTMMLFIELGKKIHKLFWKHIVYLQKAELEIQRGRKGGVDGWEGGRNDIQKRQLAPHRSAI